MAEKKRDIFDHIRVPVGETLRFTAGEEARTLDELIPLCDTHWEEAKQLLYSGDLETWLRNKKLPELSATIRQVRQQAKDKDIGLELFLQATGRVESPKWAVNIKNLTINDDNPQATFTIENIGRGHLYGTVTFLRRSGLPILIDPTEFSTRSSVEVDVTVQDFEELPINRRFEDRVIIKTQSERKEIPLSIIREEEDNEDEDEDEEDEEKEPQDYEALLAQLRRSSTATRRSVPQQEVSSLSFFLVLLKFLNVGAAIFVYLHYNLQMALYALLFFTTPLIAIGVWWQSPNQKTSRFFSTLLLPSTFALFFFGSHFLWERLWLSFLLGIGVGYITSQQLRRAFFPLLYEEQIERWRNAMAEAARAGQR